jgi:hypothetical protein
VVALTQSFAARPNPIANRTMAFPAMKPMRIVDMSCMVTNVCADGMSGVEKAPALHSDSGRRRSAFNGSQRATRNDGGLSEIWYKGKLNRQTPQRLRSKIETVSAIFTAAICNGQTIGTPR